MLKVVDLNREIFITLRAPHLAIATKYNTRQFNRNAYYSPQNNHITFIRVLCIQGCITLLLFYFFILNIWQLSVYYNDNIALQETDLVTLTFGYYIFKFDTES